MANYARTSMLINKRRFSENILIDSFGGGNRSKRSRGIAVRACVELYGLVQFFPNLLEFEVIEVVPLKPEETLHHYLRRHFEKVSKGNERRLAEQEVPKADVVPDTRSSGGNGSSNNN
jgi:hypothetical protein